MKIRQVAELSVDEARKMLTEFYVNFYKNDLEALTVLVGEIGSKPINKQPIEDIITQFGDLRIADKVIEVNKLDADTLVVIRQSQDYKALDDKYFDLVDVSTEV